MQTGAPAGIVLATLVPNQRGRTGSLGIGISIGAFFALLTGAWARTLPETRGTRVLAAEMIRDAR